MKALSKNEHTQAKKKIKNESDLSHTLYKKLTKMNHVHKCKTEKYLWNNRGYYKYFNYIFSPGLHRDLLIQK